MIDLKAAAVCLAAHAEIFISLASETDAEKAMRLVKAGTDL